MRRLRFGLIMTLLASALVPLAGAQARPGAVVARCGAGADTARPAIPSLPPGIGLPDDSAAVVASPTTPELLYYRHVVEVGFADSLSGCAVRALLAKYRAVIVDGDPIAHTYVVEVPDPGPAWSDVQRTLAAMAREGGVEEVELQRAPAGARTP
jgi:hypothetical protein